ncbi:hypothetical protein V5799_013310 [Amblyomma americanum]|uniref:Uncharacterized protein n=1 Tax=Amblyomma americanum TaxID=6943 RepID=A0AAQ4E6A4_AMBAM
MLTTSTGLRVPASSSSWSSASASSGSSPSSLDAWASAGTKHFCCRAPHHYLRRLLQPAGQHSQDCRISAAARERSAYQQEP